MYSDYRAPAGWAGAGAFAKIAILADSRAYGTSGARRTHPG